MIEEELLARLREQPTLRAAAIFPLAAPENQPPPYIVYRRDHTNTDSAMDGNDTPTARFEIECVAKTLADAKASARSVAAALDNWTGQTPAAIFSSSLQDEEHIRDRQTGLVSVFLDFDILYRK